MSIKLTSEQGLTVLTGVAIGALALIAAFDLLMPEPKVQMSPQKTAIERNKLMVGNALTEKELAGLTKQTNNLIWLSNAERIGSVSLNKVTSLAAARGLKLLAFRPQRSVQEEDLIRLPYTISIEGPYVGIVGFLKGLESPANKLAMNMVQIASADPNSDRVSATVGVIAFQKIPEAKPIVTPKPKATTKPAGTTTKPARGTNS